MTPGHLNRVFLCNGANRPRLAHGEIVVLDYQKKGKTPASIKIGLPDFVRDVYHIEDRFLDLLEIACYVYSADRQVPRGANDEVEFQSWSRDMTFCIKVRDASFWNQVNVKEKLEEALVFMTGDNSYQFTFYGGHSTGPFDLFDREDFHVPRDNAISIALFSGGLDSLAGCIELLKSSSDNLCMVSHRSGNPVTKKTQEALADAIAEMFPNRTRYYRFRSSLVGERAIHETQRTRAFLFSSIAFTMMHVYGNKRFYVFDNGVTSINLPRREDLVNARASRTTHPRTIGLLQGLFSLIEEKEMDIVNPFQDRTKTEVVGILRDHSVDRLLTSTISCGKTFKSAPNATHCGTCYQCVDRRLAIFAAGLDGADNPALYADDIISTPIPAGAGKTILLDYLAQASHLANIGLEQFYAENLKELSELIDFVPGADNEEKIERIWNLFKRHGGQVVCSLNAIRTKHDNPSRPTPRGTLIEIIANREYLVEPVKRLVDKICRRLLQAIPIMFQRNDPKDEYDFNDKVQAILTDNRSDYEREFPSVKFGNAETKPDHSIGGMDLFIESKYLRGATKPSKVTDEIGADLIKYPEESHILFVIYDAVHSIVEDERFASAFERKRKCTILVIH